MSLSEHFGEAPYFSIVTIRERDRFVTEERTLANPWKNEEKGKGLKVSKWLLQQSVDSLYTLRSLDGKGPGYVLSDADVDIVVTEAKRLEDVLKEVSRGYGKDSG